MANSRINVVFVVTYFYPMKRHSGILNFVYNLCNYLGKKLNLTVITWKFSKNVPAHELHHGYEIIRLNKPFKLRAAKYTLKLRPDLVIFGSGIYKPILLVFSFLIYRLFTLRIPLILEQFTVMDNKFSNVLRIISPLFSKFLCTSPYMEEKYRKILNDKVCYIPPGIEISQIDNIKPIEKTPRIRIGYYGHLTYNKAPDRLVNAFLKLESTNLELIISGQGPLRNMLEQKTQDKKSIILSGYLKNIKEYMKSTDILVFPYRSTVTVLGLPLTILEAMAMGKAVITSNDPSVKSIIENGVNGMIFNNENELIELLQLLVTDKNARERIGQNAKITAQNFDIKKISEQYLDLWRKYAL
ncbi:glycosyltransferase family 4 protein [bacterium]|nr:glycosyltransferase family 4 protein [bacterium]